MGYAIVILVALVIAVVAGWLYFNGAAMKESAEEGSETGDLQGREDILRYTAPPGQDPAVLVAALQKAGFATEPHSEQRTGRLLIRCPRGMERDRDRVREVIASVRTTAMAEGAPVHARVRFEDE